VADDVQLGDEVDTGRLRYPPLNLAHEVDHVPGGRALLRLEEVGVLGGHDGAADAHSLEAGGVDEAPGAVARRVAEHRSCVLAAGLVLAPPAHDVGDPGLAGAGIVGRHGELGRGDDVAAAEVRAAVAEIEGAGHAGARRRISGLVGENQHPRPPQRPHGLAPPPPAAHARRPPHRSRRPPRPTDRGIPTKNPRRARPAEADRRASTGSGTAPPARTDDSLSAVPPAGSSIASNSPSSSTTSPEKPTSDINRLEPLPITR